MRCSYRIFLLVFIFSLLAQDFAAGHQKDTSVTELPEISVVAQIKQKSNLRNEPLSSSVM